MSDQALADGLVAALKAAPAVTAILGQRIYARSPRVPTYPCLAVSRTESRIVEGEVVEHLLTLTCVSKFGGPEEARAVVATMVDAREATVSGARVIPALEQPDRLAEVVDEFWSRRADPR